MAAEVMAGTRRRCLVRPDKPTRDDRYIMERCVLYMLYKKYTILVDKYPNFDLILQPNPNDIFRRFHSPPDERDMTTNATMAMPTTTRTPLTMPAIAPPPRGGKKITKYNTTENEQQ